MDRLLFVENEPIVIKGMEYILALNGIMDLEMDSVSSITSITKYVAKKSYDICIIGQAPNGEQLLFLKDFMKNNPKLKMVIFLDNCLPFSFDELLSEGLFGILDKHDKMEQIIWGIEKIRKGQKFISKKLLQSI